MSARVKIPMMPKGVEHTHPLFPFVAVHIVKIPMMPKGVEHLRASRTKPEIKSL